MASVKDYGAVGDGVTDDSAAIRSAIAANSDVYFPTGTYIVSKDGANAYAISVPSSKRLHGDGFNCSSVKLKASQNCHVFSVPASASNVLFEDMAVDGNKSNQTAGALSMGIALNQNTTDCIVQKCYVHDCTSNGLYWGYGGNRGRASYNIVASCGDATSNANGLVFASSATDSSATGNDHAVIEGNICYSNYNANIDLSAKNSVIVGNISYSSTAGDCISAYAWEGAKHNTITGNVSIDSGLHGIHASGDYVCIVGNTILNPAQKGILHAKTKNTKAFSGVSITGNQIKTTGSTGIEVRDATTGCTIASNHVEGAASHGILLDKVTTDVGALHQEAAVTGNVSRGNGSDGIRLSGLALSTITGNVCVSNTGDGIATSTDCDNNTFTGNTCNSNGSDGISLGTNADNCLVQGNTCRGNTSTPINAAAAEATDNKITGNNTDGSRTIASAAAMTIPAWIGSGEIVEVSGTTSITSIPARHSGFVISLVFQGALTLTDGSNLKLAGNFTTTADDGITLGCNGTNWYEVGARSVN